MLLPTVASVSLQNTVPVLTVRNPQLVELDVSTLATCVCLTKGEGPGRNEHFPRRFSNNKISQTTT